MRVCFLLICFLFVFFFFFFNDTATTEIYTLSLHDALPILLPPGTRRQRGARARPTRGGAPRDLPAHQPPRRGVADSGRVRCHLLPERPHLLRPRAPAGGHPTARRGPAARRSPLSRPLGVTVRHWHGASAGM